MRHIAFILVAFVLAACNGNGTSKQGAEPDVDMTMPSDLDKQIDTEIPPPTMLCATVACAASPCTAGCEYAPPTSEIPCLAMVQTSTIAACPNFCGLFTDAEGGSILGCWYYDVGNPVCQTCGYHAECYRSDESGAKYQSGGAICTARENCGNGGPIGDLAILCDMSMPPDLMGDAGKDGP